MRDLQRVLFNLVCGPLIGGLMFFSGMLLMAYNMVKTIAGGKAVDAPVLLPAAAHA